MEQQVKEQLIKSVNSIKQKLKGMRNEKDETEINLKKVFKPITEPLEVISDILKPKNDSVYGKKTCVKNMSFSKSQNTSIDEDFQDGMDHTADEITRENEFNYDFQTPIKLENKNIESDEIIPLWMFDEKIVNEGSVLNVPFGIRSSSKQLLMGNEPVHFTEVGAENNKMIIAVIGDNKYEITPGIKELLLKKNPDFNIIREQDMLVYRDILNNTHAHRRDFNPTGQIKGDRSKKYCNVIKQLFVEPKIIDKNKDSLKYGGNLPSLKKYKPNIDLVYWDDPNELIERLQLLIASRDAGNNNHENEIISIIEELKEANVIKG